MIIDYVYSCFRKGLKQKRFDNSLQCKVFVCEDDLNGDFGLSESNYSRMQSEEIRSADMSVEVRLTLNPGRRFSGELNGPILLIQLM